MADAGFSKDPKLFDYQSTDPVKRSGFSSMAKPDSFDAVDKALLAGYEAANAGDWGQTQQMRRSGIAENPISKGGSAGLIGAHPSADKVNLLMGGQALAVPAIASQLPSGWRKALLGGLLAAKAFTVNHNQQGGLPVVKW